MKRYNPTEIESKWQQIWDETGVYTADLHSTKPKYIAMSMFNYPSGAGIHIGHALNYTISDVKARFKRQQGYESYHPVGWDAFGLPAENYAIKSGVSPQQSMAKIIPDYHKQYKAMGWSNDWEKEIATHLPEYYKWTQWIFWKMHQEGLAYQDARMQWWCEKDNSVLANEQVIDGKCWRHDGPDDPVVTKKEVKQWFFKITDYADELLEAIDDLDWTDTVKLAQKNWIGKSVGTEVSFDLEDHEKSITVFTTRPDTIFGATFLVLAPEHELVDRITTTDQKSAVAAYVQQTQQKSELERQTSKEKTGVFTGAYATNPASGEQVPVWIADYVLEGYGTGAIMAVPAHDERDHEFAKSNNLNITPVVIPSTPSDLALQYGKDVITGEEKLVGGNVLAFWPNAGQTELHALTNMIKMIKEGKEVYDSKDGILINSNNFDGETTTVAREKITTWLNKQGKAVKKVNFKMRDWSVSRQRYWGAPIPIVHCAKCGPVLVPEDQLPVVLPELDDFAPSGDGRSALARATDWLSVDCPSCGGPAERETDTLDTYICSSWYMYRYIDPRNTENIFDSELVKRWEPIDFYNGGDHATAHLLYARFMGHFFAKLGLVDVPEPFKQFIFNGKMTAQNGEMFSKSKGNGIDPLEIINQGYGADALRTYLMFAAPLDTWMRWDPQGVPGTHRFLSRLWTLVQEYLEAPEGAVSDELQALLRKSSHTMIRKMTDDIEQNHYNTAIAAAMTAVNELFKLKVDSLTRCTPWQETLEAVVTCVAPFAPHTAEELWFQLGHHMSVHKDTWPEWNEEYLVQDTITIAVQVNGKLRGEVTIDASATEADVVSAAQSVDKVSAHLDGLTVRKSIYVPERLVNFVAN